MIIVVTGLMRSGTSMVAQMLHGMGVPMGDVASFMRFPVQAPGAHLEWEDISFTEPLAKHIVGLTTLDFGSFFEAYIVRRQRTAEIWGVKSPFLLPYLGLFDTVAASLGHEIKVVLTERVPVETYESLMRMVSDVDVLEQVSKIQSQLESAWQGYESQEDLRVRIEDSWKQPGVVRMRLQALLGR